MAKHSQHQQKIIRNYYRNRSAIAIQRLQELVTELYLATGKKRQRQWELISKYLEKLEVKPDRIAYLLEKDDPELIAKIVTELDKQQ
jgi:hypothetical protein